MMVKRLIILMLFLIISILGVVGKIEAGWSSALIRVCDPNGGCYIENVYVWVNSGKFCS